MKGVMRFYKKGKLIPGMWEGPYEGWQRVGKISYELRLPRELDLVHLVFYLYM